MSLLLLAVVWGLNWPITKIGVNDYPPMTFRAACVLLGLPVLALVMVCMRISLRVPRRWWGELAKLAMANMVVWNVALMTALPGLPSGRCAALAYTMPIFAALWARLLGGPRLSWLSTSGLALGGLAMVLMVGDEAYSLTGAPGAVLLILGGAAVWGLGTVWMRSNRIDVPVLAVTFWSTALTGAVLAALACATEVSLWKEPPLAVSSAIGYNALLVFGLAQAAWFALVRIMPLAFSTLSTLLVPLVGTLAGATFLDEMVGMPQAVSLVLIVAAVACGYAGSALRRPEDTSRST